MTRHEHQEEGVVGDLFLRLRIEVDVFISRPSDRLFELCAQLTVFLAQGAVAAEEVDRLALAHGGEPGTWVPWGPVARPLAQRVQQRVLGEIFCQADITPEGCQRADPPRKLRPEDRLDRSG